MPELKLELTLERLHEILTSNPEKKGSDILQQWHDEYAFAVANQKELDRIVALVRLEEPYIPNPALFETAEVWADRTKRMAEQRLEEYHQVLLKEQSSVSV